MLFLNYQFRSLRLTASLYNKCFFRFVDENIFECLVIPLIIIDMFHVSPQFALSSLHYGPLNYN